MHADAWGLHGTYIYNRRNFTVKNIMFVVFILALFIAGIHAAPGYALQGLSPQASPVVGVNPATVSGQITNPSGSAAKSIGALAKASSIKPSTSSMAKVPVTQPEKAGQLPVSIGAYIVFRRPTGTWESPVEKPFKLASSLQYCYSLKQSTTTAEKKIDSILMRATTYSPVCKIQFFTSSGCAGQPVKPVSKLPNARTALLLDTGVTSYTLSLSDTRDLQFNVQKIFGQSVSLQSVSIFCVQRTAEDAQKKQNKDQLKQIKQQKAAAAAAAAQKQQQASQASQALQALLSDSDAVAAKKKQLESQTLQLGQKLL